jgi:hypothetical protein
MDELLAMVEDPANVARYLASVIGKIVREEFYYSMG